MGNISVYDKIIVKPENETDGIKIILHTFPSKDSASEMTYIVSSGALNFTHSLTPSKDGVRVKFKAC